QMYTCHLSVFRTDLARQVGGFSTDFEGSQDYDLVFRVTEEARQVAHTPEVLYHWRVHTRSTAADPNQKPVARTSALAAINAHLSRMGMQASAELTEYPGVYRVRREVRGYPLISLIIPVYGKSSEIRGKVEPLILHFIDSVETKSTYEN